MLYYFDKESGSYGPREDMNDDTSWSFIIPTSHWTEDMWDAITDCDKYERASLATHFSIGVHKGSDTWCDECELTADELGQELRENVYISSPW